MDGKSQETERRVHELSFIHLENNDEDIIRTLTYVSIKISLWEAITRFEPLAKKPKSVY